MRSFAIRLLVSIALAASAAGCKQKVGERCQLNSDCEGFPGMNFCAVQGGKAAAGGTCQPINSSVDLGAPDLEAPSDDAGGDAAAPADLTGD